MVANQKKYTDEFMLFDAEDVVSVLFGEAFAPAGDVVKLLSPLLLIKGVGDLMCFQVLLAANKETYFLPSRFAGAAANLAFGIPLIMRFGSCGGAVASVLSETVVNAPLFVVALKQVNVRVGGRFVGSTAASVAAMAWVLAAGCFVRPGGLLGLAAELALSCAAYIAVSLLTRNEVCLLVFRKPGKAMSGGKGQRLAYPAIDVTKLLMAIVVVEIHAKPFGFPNGLLGAALTTLENVAVPFFFIASGFLCFKGLSEAAVMGRDAPKIGRIRRTSLKLLKLYAVWTLVFLPVSAFGYWLQGYNIAKAAAYWLRGVLFVGEAALSWPLWYLLAAAVGFGLVYLMLRGVLSRRILVLSFLLMLAGWLISMLHVWDGAPVWASLPVEAYYKLFGNVRNGLFLGFFYIALGMTMGLRSERLRSISFAIPCAALTAGVTGCLLVSPDQHLPFCSLAAWGVFVLSARPTSSGKGLVAARNTSTVVYLTHMIFVVLFTYGVFGGAGPGISAADVPHGAVFACALACSLTVAAAVVPLARKHPRLAEAFGI